MQSIYVNGPARISGTVILGGNKNAALPLIAAAMLTKEEVILHHVPDILDVRNMLRIAEFAGAKVKFEKGTVSICAADIVNTRLSKELCATIRTSFLFAGPICARTGSVTLWPPGGDFIGRRRLDSHIYGLEKLGIGFRKNSIPYEFKLQKRNLRGADLFLDEASVTATEHILTTAALAKGTTILRNAAAEPHIQQVAELLCLMGAEVSGIGTNTLIVKGAKTLHGAEYTVDGDHIEAASFLSLAAATGGGIELEGNIQPRYFWMTRRVFERFGIHFRLEPGHISMPAGQRLKIVPDLGNAIPMISDGPWPQFPSDMMSCMIVAATQAKGSVLFFEKMFESRIYFVDRLIAMGANAIVCDPHRVVISGPSKLHGIEMSSPDIRAGMAMIVAAVCAKGPSVIHNALTIERGYENLIGKMASLGVDIALRPEDSPGIF